jgi:hypothetical protein
LIDIVEIAANIAPWCAPLPTAALVARQCERGLGLPPPIAVAAGAAVELTGLAAVHTALTLTEWNAQARRGEPRAPAAIAWTMPAVYIAATIILTVGLEAPPQALAFIVLSAASFVVLALRSAHRRREALVLRERAEQRAERRKAREERRKIAHVEAQAAQIEAQPTPRRATRADWRAICASLGEERRNLRAADVQNALERAGFAPVPRRTAQDWAREARGKT